jgi:hypothetical protein
MLCDHSTALIVPGHLYLPPGFLLAHALLGCHHSEEHDDGLSSIDSGGSRGSLNCKNNNNNSNYVMQGEHPSKDKGPLPAKKW